MNSTVTHKRWPGLWGIMRRNAWMEHVIFILFVIMYFNWGVGLSNKGTLWKTFAYGIMYLPGSIVVVYPMLYLLFPRMLYKRKFLQFFVWYIVLLILAKLTSELLVQLTRDLTYLKSYHVRVGHLIAPFNNMASLGASVELIRYFYFQEKKSIQAKKEKAKVELELLKSQIHPHFLFNTLNSLFAHTLRKSPESPKIVVGLSDLLRFMVYESRVEYIPLEQEIQLLKNYVDLEKLRYGNDIDVSFTYSGPIKDKLVRPLLLLPLLENAFKQGISNQLEQKWISLNLHVEGDRLHFKMAHSCDGPTNEVSEEEEDKEMRLDNVRKRLELSFPGNYVFIEKSEEDMSRISLEIPLAEDRPESFKTDLKIIQPHDLEVPVGG